MYIIYIIMKENILLVVVIIIVKIYNTMVNWYV